MNRKNNKAIRFNEMLKYILNDELGLFEKHDEVLKEIRRRIGIERI
ncbi:hypothetical protein [Clostridium botulinum]|nr:hypothetical protein [Clostridium botulinum]AEB76464.1 putative hypothetical protein [Clostridium botulinum BKT015925]MCD3197521.1 hypothetical protein [Clostridium botulinum C/D]MCD3202010.1 hypothetical protein [Clostridium botulinum C/D]MCD3212019.1 hypothetical protein [Clostridium botulinum C/D]MCD3214252.1 hypothetical protein [Clostridium botulinum C/D]